MTYFVCRPEVAKVLRENFPEENLSYLPGVEILVKNDQKQDAWAFTKVEEMRRYLNGEITESDLISLAKLN